MLSPDLPVLETRDHPPRRIPDSSSRNVILAIVSPPSNSHVLRKSSSTTLFFPQVNLGKAIAGIVKGYVSTEVDPRLSFDKEESLVRARRIIAMYEAEGVPRTRVLIKLAATWEGIMAAEELEKEGITCNLTLVFGITQVPCQPLAMITP